MNLPPRFSSVLRELASLLYWTMLAACTVGPGTVVTCARAGAEYNLSMVWALVFASVLAYVLQEGTARLTIVSGLSLGQCLRLKYRHGCKIYNTALICWLVGMFVFFGNTLYECNNWAGGIDAILSLPGAENSTGLRVGCCIAYAVVVLSLLYLDKTDMLGIFLGLIMIGMVTLFLIVVIVMGLDWESFGWGFVPNIPEKASNISAEPTDIVVSLVGTTSIGFNLFLGSAMASGKELISAQRGIAFSTISAFLVSVLILIVGAGAYEEGGTQGFNIGSLGDVIEVNVGVAGLVVFGVGFIAAALSSMLTVPLGAALTADSVFSDPDLPATASKGRPNPNFQDDSGQEKGRDDLESQPTDSAAPENGLSGVEQQNGIRDKVEKMTKEEEGEVGKQKFPRWLYLGLMFVMVSIATIVISCDADRIVVILIAQVFNGCLLPFFSICLLLCINDKEFMAAAPQKGWANLLLFLCVGITLFLASNVVIQKLFGQFLEGLVYVRLIISAGIAVVVLGLLCFLTSLGRDVLRSLKTCR